MFGLGSVAQVVTGQGAFGQYISINLGFGLGVAMGVHVGGKVSGRGVPSPSAQSTDQPRVVVVLQVSPGVWSRLGHGGICTQPGLGPRLC